MGVIGVVDGALEEVLVEAVDVVVGLDLTGRVVAVEREGADVLAHLLHRLQRLHHLRSFVQHVLPHRHWLSRSIRIVAADRVRSRWLVT